MDPQSIAFTPREDNIWRFQTDVAKLQQATAEHSERLLRLERRQEEENRMKSVWGNQSPFPGILSGTPQQQPLQQPPSDAFSGFDDQSANLIGSLHLDADEEPRRIGAVSRANSVRFDETANHGHWSHPSRTSIDFMPRSGSSLGSHPIERTYSHKSDGRQSSAGQSVHSAVSRANSLGLDTLAGLGAPDSLEGPALAPGLFLLGTVPAIIRCWLTKEYKHDALLYAALCSGSYASTVSEFLIHRLGFGHSIRLQEDGTQKIKLNMALPEAVVRSTSSRSGSPFPQLPSITIDFTVMPPAAHSGQDRAIQIVLGSDILRAHNADILFSKNSVTLFDDERSRVSIPLVRPEDDRAFKSLQTFNSLANAEVRASQLATEHFTLNGLKQTSPRSAHADISSKPKSPTESLLASGEEVKSEAPPSLDSSPSRSSIDEPPALNVLTSQSINQPSGESSTAPSARTPASGTSPALWDNWRRGDKPADWGPGRTTASNYAPRPQGIKTFRLAKPTSRAVSGAQPTTSSPQSRFFEEGKRRVSGDSMDSKKASSSTGNSSSGATKEGAIGKSGNLNPVGGSAFSWLAK
jgi:ubiquitin carboxyl-terminal hydrolase 4/11/15